MSSITVFGLWLLQIGPPIWGGGQATPFSRGGPPGPWTGLPNVLAIAVWGLLLLLASSRFRSGVQPPARKLLAYGFAAGMAFQAILLLAEVLYLHRAGWFRPRGISYVFLIEVGALAEVLVIAGLLGSTLADQAHSKKYLRLSLITLGAALLAAVIETGWMLAAGIPAVRPMHASIVVLVAGLGVLAMGAIVAARRLSGSSRWIALGAIGCFIVGVGIRFLGLAVPSEWIQLFAGGPIIFLPTPIAAVYSTDAGIVGALLIGFLFIRNYSAELRTDFTSLEERVQERTAELERTMEDLAVANAKLIEQSTVDSLTGVGNRRFFDEALHNEWAIAIREGRSLAVALVDIDHFKQINDCFGHQKGDECLVRVASVLQGGARRPADVLARFGGDEFVLLLPGVGLEGAYAVLEQARNAIEVIAPGPGQSLTISAGAAACIPRIGLEPESLLKSADERLYAAKQSGRNRIAVGALAAG